MHFRNRRCSKVKKASIRQFSRLRRAATFPLELCSALHPALREIDAAAEQGQLESKNSFKYQRYVKTHAAGCRDPEMSKRHLGESFHERWGK
ncbi:hypothetical protein [Sinorhizobium sp. A49]|uniref:hypothetical protein n=1 Tax=Sinorhizobium sp. A49 TaxID=1945861 RepID=UPI001115A78B|nr:hypothetical protein [Sinorhizobium sp. A49]